MYKYCFLPSHKLIDHSLKSGSLYSLKALSKSKLDFGKEFSK
jgi:hypothetical protein